MEISAGTLTVGDVICMHDWHLHVVAVEHDIGTVALTAEFDFPLHFGRYQTIEVLRAIDARRSAA